MPDPNDGPRPTAVELLIVGAAFVALSCVMLWPLPTRMARSMPYAFGDPMLVAWMLGWGADRLADGYRGLWQAPILYPYADTFAYSETLLGVSIFLAPVYWATRNAVLVYNLALLASAVLAGTATYALVKSLVGRRDAAALAAVAFAFTPYRVAQLGHLQVLMCGWMPLALLGLHRYMRTGARPALALFALAFVLQALSNGYFLFFLAIASAVILASEAWPARGAWSRRLPGLVIAGVAILLVMAPVIAAYSRVQRMQGLRRSRAEVVAYSADLTSYFRVSPEALLWSRLLAREWSETTLFPGLLVLVLAGCAVAFGRRAASDQPVGPDRACLTGTASVYLALAFVAVLLSLGPEPRLWGGTRLPTGPYAWLMAVVPGMSGLRVAARIAIVAYLGLAVAAGCGFALLRGSRRGARWSAALAACCLVVLVEGYSRVGLNDLPSPDMVRDRAVYRWLRSQPAGPMLELPAGELDAEVRYVLHTLEHDNRIVNGYTGYEQPLLELVAGPPTRETPQIGSTLHMLRRLGVRFVVVHSELYADRAFAASLRSAIRDARDEVEASFNFGPTEVFRLRPGRSEGSEPAPQGRLVAQASLVAAASHNGALAGRLLDGDRRSRWYSGKPQSGDEWIQITLDRTRLVTHVRLEMERRSFGDYPRHLLVEASDDGRTFRQVHDDGALTSLAVTVVSRPQQPDIDIPIAPTAARVLRIRQTGRTPRMWFWAVHEVRVWEGS